MLRTEFEFTLPFGYADEHGTLHREGVMRRATAADEILPLQDARVVKNPAYLVVLLLSRVVSRLGTLSPVNCKVVESLYASDLEHLQKLYNKVNRLEGDGDDAAPTVVCPYCEREFRPDPQPNHEGNGAGGSLATPSTSSTRR
jgi:hypothetical protein